MFMGDRDQPRLNKLIHAILREVTLLVTLTGLLTAEQPEAFIGRLNSIQVKSARLGSGNDVLAFTRSNTTILRKMITGGNTQKWLFLELALPDVWPLRGRREER